MLLLSCDPFSTVTKVERIPRLPSVRGLTDLITKMAGCHRRINRIAEAPSRTGNVHGSEAYAAMAGLGKHILQDIVLEDCASHGPHLERKVNLIIGYALLQIGLANSSWS